MFSIRQNPDDSALWEVLGPDGQVLTGGTFDSYGPALAFLGETLRAELVAEPDTTEAGLLPETWEDVTGICYSQETGDGRDFSSCAWSWRDPTVSTLPLMLQTTTEFGHFGATLAGFMAELHDNTTPHASGRFYDNEAGRQFRDMLLGGRRFGVSVDPGHVVAEWQCLEEDEDGWCIRDQIIFLEYVIIGLTGTPFPGFAEAAIQLRADAAVAASAGTVTDSGVNGHVVTIPAQAARPLSIPVRPPAAWLNVPEPQLGQTGMVDVYGMPVNELLVEQPDGSLAVPLTILDSGQVYGHLAARGTPHTGYPGRNVRVPVSRRAYADWHLGVVHTDDGQRVPAGTAVFGCEHAPLRDAHGAVIAAGPTRDFYAHSGASWAQFRVQEGEHGPWVCGSLLPDITEPQLRLLRALTLSGDWREIAGALELIGVLAVNVPGFRIAREAITASGVGELPTARPAGVQVGTEHTALVAANTVRRCRSCQERAALVASGGIAVEPERVDTAVRDVLVRMERTLATLERRTRPLVSTARDDLARRIHAGTN